MKNQVEILNSYLECALWTEEKDNKTISDVGASTVTQAKKDIADFMSEAEPLLTDWSEEQIGHDFWLTRNRHGAGFWDREFPNAEKVSEIAGKFKELNVWENELNIIYFE